MLFDLPTEAQWEYACRSGTTTGLNSGLNYSESNLKQVARCSFNTSDGKGGFSQHTVVGCYRDSAWGLYDMHGNVREWCRDFTNYGGLGGFGAIDPKGAGSGYVYGSGYDGSRVTRGGCYNQNTQCRSAYRYPQEYLGSTQKSSSTGFRVMCSPVAE